MSAIEVGGFLYLNRDPLHLKEKPYKLRYDPGDNVPRSNITNESKGGIKIHDARCNEDISFEKRGFLWTTLESELSASDFYDEQRVRDVYYPELRTLLQKHFNPARIEIIEHRTRKRHESFPIATGKKLDSKNLQPTTIVHLDYTPQAAEDISTTMLNVPRNQYSRLQCLNLWKPLHGPVLDWPLALCDPRSVDSDTDVAAIDVVFRNSFTENAQLYYNPNHKWYYLSKQLDTEVIIFRQYDSALPHGQGVPHSAFHIARNENVTKPRESIEVRVFLYYE